MDWVLSFADQHVLTPYVYPASVPEDNVLRQFVSLFGIVSLGAVLMYLSMASFAYVFLFDKRLRQHKFFLKNQVRVEWINMREEQRRG